MALALDRPDSFEGALETATRLLSRNPDLVRRGVVATESEQIVIAAYRKVTGQVLSRVDFFARIKDRIPPLAAETVILYSVSRAEGRPLQYILGYQAFLDHEYRVWPGVLVPRPETEVLVVSAIEELSQRDSERGIEIGIGSGVISTELLHQYKALEMLASEVSEVAIRCAEENALEILGAEGAERLKIIRSASAEHVWGPIQTALGEKKVDFIISNPPYLDPMDAIEKEVFEHEPLVALFPSVEGPLYFYNSIAGEGKRFLKPFGMAFLEVPHQRSEKIRDLFLGQGWKTKILKDLTGRDRVLIAELGPEVRRTGGS